MKRLCTNIKCCGRPWNNWRVDVFGMKMVRRKWDVPSIPARRGGNLHFSIRAAGRNMEHISRFAILIKYAFHFAQANGLDQSNGDDTFSVFNVRVVIGKRNSQSLRCSGRPAANPKLIFPFLKHFPVPQMYTLYTCSSYGWTCSELWTDEGQGVIKNKQSIPLSLFLHLGRHLWTRTSELTHWECQASTAD